ERVHPAAGFVDGVDEHPLVVGLHATDLQAQAPPLLHEAGVELGQGEPPVELRLALPGEVQVRTMEDEDLSTHRLSMGTPFRALSKGGPRPPVRPAPCPEGRWSRRRAGPSCRGERRKAPP